MYLLELRAVKSLARYSIGVGSCKRMLGEMVIELRAV